jgi:hypothetical protein
MATLPTEDLWRVEVELRLDTRDHTARIADALERIATYLEAK